jgi:hypothetical protein
LWRKTIVDLVFWRLHGHASMGGLCTVPWSPGSHWHASPDPKFWQTKNSETMVHCRLGIPERRVGDGRRCACYGYAAAARRRRSREHASSCTPGRRPGVPRAALLHGRLHLSSGTTDAGHAPSHTRLCASHRACAAAANGNDHPLCTMDAEKREPQSEPLEACVPPELK